MHVTIIAEFVADVRSLARRAIMYLRLEISANHDSARVREGEADLMAH